MSYATRGELSSGDSASSSQARFFASARRFLVTVTCACAAAALTAPALAQQTERVSVDSSDAEGNGQAYRSATSGDGRFVVFASDADNLVPEDTNGASDIFVHDRRVEMTARVSVDSQGREGNRWSRGPSISVDGRFVAFCSDADNLVSGDHNAVNDVFLHDISTGTTTRVSVDSHGNAGNGNSAFPSVSADGSLVAFRSDADNLVQGDTNAVSDVFLHDTRTGTTTRVSVDSSGAEANQTVYRPSLCEDGGVVAFTSGADNLVAGDDNGKLDVFVRDLASGTTTRVSVDAGGGQGNDGSSAPSISGGGRFVVFHSDASNLVPGDTNGLRDVFLHDRFDGATSRLSVDSEGLEANGISSRPSISRDGRFVAFASEANNLVRRDLNERQDVFLRDRLPPAPGMTRVSVDSSGSEASGRSGAAWVSSDGRFVSFRSHADNLVTDDTNGNPDVFVHGNYLTLEASPETVTTGDAIELTTWVGLTSGRVFLVLVQFNQESLFRFVLKGKFDGSGFWNLSGTIPPGLSGNVMAFKAVGFTPKGDAEISNAETITFQ